VVPSNYNRSRTPDADAGGFKRVVAVGVPSPAEVIHFVFNSPVPERRSGGFVTHHWQADRCCGVVYQWRGQILEPKTLGGRKKQLIVAPARGFGVDWWRLCTSQTTPEKRGPVLAD